MKKVVFPFLFILPVVFAFASCKNKEKVQQAPQIVAATNVQATKQDDDSLMVSFRRTACFGQCPTYEICVYKSGYATFHGQHFVQPEGWNYQYVDMNFITTLCEEARDQGYFELKESYTSDIPDFPGTITYIHLGKQKLKVVNNHGEVPEVLTTFEKKVDSYLRQVNWLPLPDKNKE